MKLKKFRKGMSAILMLTLILGFLSFYPSVSNAGTQPKEITIACSQDSYPFHFKDERGKAAGITVDFWNLWSEKTGIKVNYLISDWDTSLQNVKDKKADVHAGCFYTHERDGYLDYAYPIAEAETHIFYNSALQNIREHKDIKPYTIGVLKGDYAEGFLKNSMKDVSLRLFNSYEEIMEAAKEGTLQVFVADTVTALTVMEKTIPKGMFTYNKDEPLYTNFFYAAAQDGKSDLVLRINEGMGSITAAERQLIMDKWLPDADGGMKSVKVAISMDYPPFTYPDINGKPQGLLIDMWRLWGKKTGIEVQFAPDTWTNTLNALGDGTAQIHSGLFYTEDRSKTMNFSRTFYEVESKVFFNSSQRNFTSVKDLQGKTIGANRNSYQELYLKENYPGLNVIGFDYSTSMVEAAEYGLLDAFIEEAVTLKGNYQVSGKAFNNKSLPDVSFKRDMLAGVSKDKPELLDQVNKGLEKITRDEWYLLESKWIADPGDRVYQELKELELTDAEKAWIIKHPVLRIGTDVDAEPIEYVEGNVAKGIAADYAKYIMDRIGMKAETKVMSWPEILKGISMGDSLDASFNIVKTDERSEYLTFSRPFLKIPHMIATKTDKKLINSLADLSGLTVAVERGYYKIEHLKKNPEITLLEVDSTIEALLAVSSGRADAYIGDKLTITHQISQKSLKNLRVSEYMELGTYNVSAGFRNELSPLADIINKALDAMTESEKKAILSKYTSLTEEGSISLSDSEEVWLRNHNPVRAGMQTGWAPVEYVDEFGEIAGVSSDYSTRLERVPNVQLGPVMSSSYGEMVEMLRTGKIDIITAAVKSPYKNKYMSFSKPYMISPMTLITLDDSPFVGGIDNISTERLGVIQEGFAEDMLKLNHSSIRYLTYPDEASLYQALADGKVDLILDSMVSIDYMSRLKRIDNLRVSSITAYNYEICVGVRRDWAPTLTVINRLFDSINTLEKDSTEKYWLSKLPPERQTWEKYRNSLITVSLVAILIVALIVFWNRRLQAEINERKLMECALKSAKEAADVANRSKTEFLANMSHEIRTPMNAVIGMGTLMGRTELNHQQRDYLTKIIQATYTLLNIINDILDFSKIEAGRMDLEEVEFELESVLNNVASIVGLRAKDKDIEFIISKAGDVPLKLYGDPLRLEQVLVNLASNAVKFTHKGEVEINIASTGHQDDQIALQFNVRDTGIGMSDDQVSLLFQPFTQSDSSTTRKFGGTGLGLSISKKLVELMGGHIWAQCQLGGGCVFSFEIQLRFLQDSGPAFNTAMKKLGDLRVLVVEDNPSAREVMERYLDDFKLSSDSFESGEEALEALTLQTYDLVLMDWRLGGIDGLETSKKIREMNLPNQPKIVMVTAYGNDELVESIKEDGVDGMLMKPVSESMLFNTIHNLFSEEPDHDAWTAPLRMKLNEAFLKGHRILVVEDNAMNQQLARELLVSVGAEVHVSGNGKEALEHLRMTEEEYSIIFMDLQMPEMDGFESTQGIRLLERWSETPIIAMTADVLPGIYENCIRSGMNDYVSKPISVEELYEKLAFWLEIKESFYSPETEEDKLRLNLTGVDLNKAVKNLGGSLDLYKMVLERFAETYRTVDSDIPRLLQEEVREDALRYFHTLKGHGGNVGSELIAKEAEMAEQLIKYGEENELKAMSGLLSKHVRTLVEEINKNLKLQETTGGSTQVWSYQELAKVMEELLPSLHGKKATLIQEKILQLAEKKIPEELEDRFKEFRKQCDRYKYKDAAAMAEEIMAKLRSFS